MVIQLAFYIDRFILLRLPEKLPLWLSLLFQILQFILYLITGKNLITRILESGFDQGTMIKCLEAYIRVTFPEGLGKEDLLDKMLVRPALVSRLHDAINRIFDLISLKEEVQWTRQTTFDKTKPEHMRILNETYKNLTGEAAPIIPDKQWDEIGFQGTDPSTDFRGMGLLGLQQLHRFSQTPQGRSVYKSSVDPEQVWFPFAITGINITAFQFILLNSGQLDIVIYGGENLQDTFDRVFLNIFCRFHLDWLNKDPKDIMDFPRIFAVTKANYIASLL